MRTSRSIKLYGVFLFVLVLLFGGSLSAREANDSWDDLEEDVEYYGMEREQKFPVRSLFVDVEDWEGHYSFSIAPFYRFTDYPKFKSSRVLFPPFPLYYHLESKIDDRVKSWLFPIYYYKHDNDYDSYVTPLGFWSGTTSYRDYSFLYLYYGGSEDQTDSFYSTLLPLYTYSERDSDLEEKSSLLIFPILSGFKTVTHKDSYKEREVFVYSPLLWYKYERNQSGEAWTDINFPILPILLYYRSGPSGSRMDILASLIGYTSDTEGLESGHIFPLVWYQRGPDGYTHIAPFYFNDRSSTEGNTYFGPLYYIDHDKQSGSHYNMGLLADWHVNLEGDVDRFWFMPLFWYKEGSDGYTHIAPFYFNDRSSTEGNTYFGPLYYIDHDKQSGSHYNMGLLADWHVDLDGDVDRFWFMPLFWYKAGSDGYTHIAPFYFNDRSSTEGNTYFGPLYYIDHDKQSGSHYNMGLLADWHVDLEGDVDRFWFMPLFWYKEGSDGYTHIAPFYFNDRSSTEGNTYFGPLYYIDHDKQSGSHYNMGLLADWHVDLDGDVDRFWFMPLFYYEKESYFYFFPFYVRPSALDAKEGFSISPVHYHEWDEDMDILSLGYLYYHKEYKKSDRYFRTFFPLYYSWKLEESSGDIVLPVYFSYRDRDTQFDLVLGLFWENQASALLYPDQKTEWNGTKKYYLRSEFSLFYELFRITTKTMVYEETVDLSDSSLSSKDMDLLNTVLEYSKREEEKYNQESENPEVKQTHEEIQDNDKENGVAIKKSSDLNVESADEYYELSLLFGLFNYTRADNMRHLRVLPLTYLTWDEASDDKLYLFPPFLPLYLHYVSGNEEYQVLFPVYAYQQEGDSFIESILLNMYIHNHDGENKMDSYNVVWPLFRYRTSPQGWSLRLLPLLYHRFEERDRDRETLTAFPLFYHKDINRMWGDESEDYFTETISPLYYYKYEQNENEDSDLFMLPILPIYYRSVSRTYESDERIFKDRTSSPGVANPVESINKSKSLAKAPILIAENTLSDSSENSNHAPIRGSPLNTRKVIRESRFGYLFPLYIHSSELSDSGGYSNHFAPFIPLFGSINRLTNRSENGKTYINDKAIRYLFPFFYYQNEYTAGNFQPENIQGSGIREQSFLITPLFYNASYNVRSGEEIGWGDRFILYVPFFYRWSGSDSSRYNIMGVVDWRVDRNTNELTHLFIAPFYYDYDPESKDKTYLFFPLFWSQTNHQKDGHNSHILAPFYYGSENRSLVEEGVRSRGGFENEYEDTLLFPVFYRSAEVIRSYDDGGLSGGRIDYQKEINNLITPLFYYDEEDIRDGGVSSHESTFVSFIPFVYRYSDNDMLRYNIMGVVDWKRDLVNDRLDHLFIFPYLYDYDPSNGSRTHAIYPLFWYESGKDYYELFALGLYLYEDKNYVRRNFLFLADYEEDFYTEYKKYDFLFGGVHWKRNKHVQEFSILYGLAFDYKSYYNSPDYNMSAMLLFYQGREGNEFYSTLFPFYYYNDDGYDELIMVPYIPVLYYSNTNPNEGLEMVLMGTVWYHRYDRRERRELKLALGGIAYYERQRPKRGYRSRGSFWGYLWSYDDEEDTDYESLSILDFVYSETFYDGETVTRVFGFRL